MKSPNAEDMTDWICKQFTGPAERDRVLRHMRIYARNVLASASQEVEGYLITWPAGVSFVQDTKRHTAINIVGRIRTLMDDV